MADSARFSQSHAIIPLYLAATNSYNGGGTFDSINMAKYNHCTIVIYGDAAVAGNGILTISGGASDGATTAAITFTYRYGTAITGAATSDTLGTPATSAALTITGTSLVSAILVVEIDAEDLQISGTQYQWITAVLDATGTAGMCSAIGILSEPRIQQAVMPTAVS